MSNVWESLRTMMHTARYALEQLNIMVPDYWDGALTTAARVALTALPLFACVLFAQLVLLVAARKKRPRRILTFAGTLAVVLALTAWAYWPMPVTQGDVSTVSVQKVEDGDEASVQLTTAQLRDLTDQLEHLTCRRGAGTALPETEDAAYRITYETQDGAVNVWASRAGCVRYTSEERGLLYPVFSGSALYRLLAE